MTPPGGPGAAVGVRTDESGRTPAGVRSPPPPLGGAHQYGPVPGAAGHGAIAPEHPVHGPGVLADRL